jgi:3-oxoacyl-[acyl-carrier protein] reductase
MSEMAWVLRKDPKMDLRLKGKRALVTGSSRGIGATIAKELAAEGAIVLVHGQDKTRAQGVADAIIALDGQSFVVTGNLSSDAGAAYVAGEAERLIGGVDILINNVGAFVNRTWETASADNWAELYNINVLSAVRLIRLLTPGMRERHWGRVIQVATAEATDPFANMPDYAASKAAMLHISVSLAKYLSGTGITANTISPGIIVTDAVEEWYRKVGPQNGWGETWTEIEQGILRDVLPNTVGRLGHIEEVAALVTFLASPLSAFINGSNYRIDGGSTSTVN